MQRIVPIAFFIAAMLATGSTFGQEQSLAEEIMDADEAQFIGIFPKLKEQAEQEIPVLIGEIERTLPPDANDDFKEKLAKRQANAAVALLRLNHPEKVWQLLKHSPDPRARSYLIHRMGLLGVDPKLIIDRLEVEGDVSIRRALILSLGEFDVSAIPLGVRKILLPKFQGLYRSDSDPGLHAASEWLLRKWQQNDWLRQVNEEWAKNKEMREKRLGRFENGSPQWYVNGQEQTMVIIPGPVEFMMGSPETEMGRSVNERQHMRRICRTFSISSKLVTLDQYQRFDSDYLPSNEAYARTADLPVVETSWFQAVAYCNWLSKEEGISEDQWCYEIKGEKTKLKENYLSLAGYRLPTEAELEYATRVGATTARYYGETDELLAKYAWYEKNSRGQTQQVGRLKPNDLGLFDVHGNLLVWCQNQYVENPTGEQIVEDKEGELSIVATDLRVLRGGYFSYQSSYLRSASRSLTVPTIRSGSFGFRLARTLPLVPQVPLSTP